MKKCLRCKSVFSDSGWICPRCGYAPDYHDDYPIFAPELALDNNAYTVEFFANLAELEAGHFWFEARNRLLLWAVQHYFPDINNLLEIGCGTGFVLKNFKQHLNGVQLFGSDLLFEGLTFAGERVPAATLFQMDACDIPYHQEFDLIGAFDVIEHIEEDELALTQMYRAIKPGGGLILSVPQHQFLWSVVDELSYHKRRYSRNELTDKVEKAGFHILKTTSFVSLLLPFMLFNRSRKASAPEDFDIYAEFQLNPLLNAALARMMMLEVQCIRMGITFLSGGSRLLMAKRPERETNDI